jgi:hypothetical protein
VDSQISDAKALLNNNGYKRFIERHPEPLQKLIREDRIEEYKEAVKDHPVAKSQDEFNYYLGSKWQQSFVTQVREAIIDEKAKPVIKKNVEKKLAGVDKSVNAIHKRETPQSASEFLKKYMEASGRASVVCGGLTHPDEIPMKGMELRYLYEKNAAYERSAGFRSQNPYLRFTSFSFLIDRDVFMSIRFDESYVRYGYEDVQFGHELEENGVSILHIDNPLAHIGLDDSASYLNKTRHAVQNAFDHQDEIGDSSKLLTNYNKVRSLRMRWVFRFFWAFFQKSMEKNLLGPKPKLRIFSLYKLCYISVL